MLRESAAGQDKPPRPVDMQPGDGTATQAVPERRLERLHSRGNADHSDASQRARHVAPLTAHEFSVIGAAGVAVSLSGTYSSAGLVGKFSEGYLGFELTVELTVQRLRGLQGREKRGAGGDGGEGCGHGAGAGSEGATARCGGGGGRRLAGGGAAPAQRRGQHALCCWCGPFMPTHPHTCMNLHTEVRTNLACLHCHDS